MPPLRSRTFPFCRKTSNRQILLQLHAPPLQLWEEFHGVACHERPMARLPRIVVPDCPHHVTARGNRREPIFFENGDQDIYCDMLAEQMRKAEVEVWAYCLMPNHVHLILCPRDTNSLARALGAAHKRWANFINGRGRWRGHLFDGRFASVAMDES